MKDMYIYQDNVTSPEEKLKNLKYEWAGKDVLELGCNIGKLGVMVCEKGANSYMGIDIDKKMIEIGRERYKLRLYAGDVETYELKADVIVAMALFHHFDEEKLRRILNQMDCNELIFEVPVGEPSEKYHCREQGWYIDLIQECFGSVKKIVKSGATNDPFRERVIFICEYMLE